MKKIPFKSLLLFITVAFIFSCHKESSINSNISTLKISSSEIVPINTARNAAFLFAGKNITPFQRGGSGTLDIENEDSVVDNTKPYFYIFNFKNNSGFVIVSAEKREHPILAYSEKGNFSHENAPEGINLWIETTKENIDNIRKGMFNTKKQTDTEWKLIGKETSPIRNVPIDPGCQDKITVYTKGPFLATSWGQGCPFNHQCPTSDNSAYCNHCPTGCVATAMSQVMRYWQKPTTYNWASISNYVGGTELDRLMRDIGTSVNMHYDVNASSASDSKIPSALKGTFHYASANRISYNVSSYLTVQNDLNAGRPVLLCGYSSNDIINNTSGHEWVCDGYKQTDIYWCNSDGTGGENTYLQFHMNWGWDGDGGPGNGWYSYDTWAPVGTTYNFQYYRAAIVNIYP